MKLVMLKQSMTPELFVPLFLQVLEVALKYDANRTRVILDSFNFKYEIKKDD